MKFKVFGIILESPVLPNNFKYIPPLCKKKEELQLKEEF